ALVITFLTGVAREGDRSILAEIADEFLALAVGQGVHRVDDDGPGTRRRVLLLGTQHGIDDRQEKAERLARAGAGSNYKAFALPAEGDGLLLVTIEVDREVPGGKRMQLPVGGQLLRAPPRCVPGIDL